MKDFYIQDYQITETGYYYDNFATKARLDYDSYWLSDVSKYMTVNLISPRRITHIATQGGIDPGNYVKYMSFFAVKFKLLNGTLIDYMENGKIRVSFLFTDCVHSVAPAGFFFGGAMTPFDIIDHLHDA